MSNKKRVVYISSITGKYVTEAYAKANPKTTVAITLRPRNKKKKK